MLKTVVISILNFLVNKLPDTWKIIIGVFILFSIALYFLRGIGISESKAYSDSLHALDTLKFEAVVKYNDVQITNMVRHSDKQFELLRNDINSLRKQNSDIIKILINKNK